MTGRILHLTLALALLLVGVAAGAQTLQDGSYRTIGNEDLAMIGGENVEHAYETDGLLNYLKKSTFVSRVFQNLLN